MKISEPCAGLLSNSEVLEVLRGRKADQPLSKAHAAERITCAYLADHSAGVRSSQELTKLFEALQPFRLMRGEVLQILNLVPRRAVEIHLIVEDAEARLGEDRIDELLTVVERHLLHKK